MTNEEAVPVEPNYTVAVVCSKERHQPRVAKVALFDRYGDRWLLRHGLRNAKMQTVTYVPYSGHREDHGPVRERYELSCSLCKTTTVFEAPKLLPVLDSCEKMSLHIFELAILL